ncbi:hypothetical protein ACFE04_019014 [Oxalis oulophora]
MACETIEHIVLFKLKPQTDPSKVNAMLTGLNSLISLHQVIHISAGPLHHHSNFTHILHSRYSSKQNLAAYSANPSHVSVVQNSVLPICQDIMAVDWVDLNLHEPKKISPGSAVRVTLLKLKENVAENAKSEILETIKTSFGFTELSFGDNFSPARGKGFSICSLAVFGGLSEMQATNGNSHIGMLRDYLDDSVVVDYVVPSPLHVSRL